MTKTPFPRPALQDVRTRIKAMSKIGNGKSALFLDNASMGSLLGFIEQDMGCSGVITALPDALRPDRDYFETDPHFTTVDRRIGFDLEEAIAQAAENILDAERVLESLCHLHLRRVKLANIWATQNIPDIAPLAYRGLIEMEGISPTATAGLIRLRKHLYDIDNRVAQESAMLYTAIISRALGGASYTSKNSPIVKLGTAFSRRHVDCIAGDHAYEFKGRLTEAPSRRARLDDEIQFPRDCHARGYTPVLLSFHQEVNESTERLVEAYQRNNGKIFIGDAAWAHLYERAGKSMTVFLRRYVTGPIEAIQKAGNEPVDIHVSLRSGRTSLEITPGEHPTERLVIQRAL